MEPLHVHRTFSDISQMPISFLYSHDRSVEDFRCTVSRVCEWDVIIVRSKFGSFSQTSYVDCDESCTAPLV